jgi:glycosyltransferase involved in cell wall biosynthesis
VANPAASRESTSVGGPSSTVSVVISAYTEARWANLVAAVEAVDGQTRRADELIVVVDHNASLLARAQSKLGKTRAVANVDERGLSGARNTGWRLATGDIIVFLDDDATPEPTWLEELLREYDDEVAGLGGAALPQFADGVPRWFPSEFNWVIGCSYTGLPKTVAPIRNPLGANMSFRRDALEAVGGFTHGIGRIGMKPLGCEETELAIRVRSMLGGEILYVPAARVHHFVPADRLTWRYFLARCWAEGLSKALITAGVGQRDALASERSYTLRVLPKGVVKGVSSALRGDPYGLLRATAIVVGFGVTTSGYARGRLGRIGAPLRD